MAIEKNVLITLGAKLGAGFGAASTRAQGFLNRLKTTSDSIFSVKNALMGGGVYLAATRLYGMAKSTANTAQEMKKLHSSTGIAYETLSKMKYTAETTGSSIETFTKSFKQVALTVEEARKGSKEYSDVLQQLGLNAEDLRNMSLEQIFLKTSDAISRAGTQTEKIYLATKLYGRSGMEVLGILNDMPALFEEATRYGTIWSEKTVGQGLQVEEAIHKAEQSVKKFTDRMVLALAPYAAVLAGAGTEGAAEMKAARNLRAFSDFFLTGGGLIGEKRKHKVWKQWIPSGEEEEYKDIALGYLREHNAKINKAGGPVKVNVDVNVSNDSDKTDAAARATRMAAAGNGV